MRNISRITPCCKPPIERINSMPADCNGDFTVEQGPGARITTVTNGIRIEMLDLPFSNTDGNIILDEPNRTIDLNDDIHIVNDLTVDGEIIVDTLRNNHNSDYILVDCALQVNDFVVIDGNVGIQGNLNMVGNLRVIGDIVQDGASYETHAEKVYTTNDYIYMRDEAVAGLAVGAYSGFQVKKYDGTNDGRFVIDNTGTARVGDVGDEQPLLTREESANLNNGALLNWDSSTMKAVDEGTVGDDTHPIKIVNGIATAVTDDLIKKSSLFFSQGSTVTTGSSYVYYGFVDTATRVFITINLPKLLDRPFTLSITSMEVKGVNGSFTLSSNPISTIATNNQTFDTIRVAVTFTNAHGLTLNTPISGFLTYTLTVN